MAEDQLELLVHAGFLPAVGVQSNTVESDGSVFPHLLHVVGWSMGGMIATHLATLIQAHHGVHPHSILASLTLASSSPGGWSAPSGLSLVTLPRSVPPWRGVLLCLRTILSLRTSARIRRILELHYAPSFYAQHKHELSDVYAQRAPFDRSIFSYLFSLVQHALAVTFHFSSPSELLALRGSGLPVLVIAGEDDNLVSIENSRVLAQQLGATLAVAPASGHMVISLELESTRFTLSLIFDVCLVRCMSRIAIGLRVRLENISRVPQSTWKGVTKKSLPRCSNCERRANNIGSFAQCPHPSGSFQNIYTVFFFFQFDFLWTVVSHQFCHPASSVESHCRSHG
jgi:pimeloyl-ACP methyl ester carboxylesterase